MTVVPATVPPVPVSVIAPVPFARSCTAPVPLPTLAPMAIAIFVPDPCKVTVGAVIAPVTVMLLADVNCNRLAVDGAMLTGEVPVLVTYAAPAVVVEIIFATVIMLAAAVDEPIELPPRFTVPAVTVPAVRVKACEAVRFTIPLPAAVMLLPIAMVPLLPVALSVSVPDVPVLVTRPALLIPPATLTVIELSVVSNPVLPIDNTGCVWLVTVVAILITPLDGLVPAMNASVPLMNTCFVVLLLLRLMLT